MTTEVLPFNSVNGSKPLTRIVALLGYAEETREFVHDLPPDAEIWGINAAHYFLKRPAHVWFQLHPRDWATSGGPPTGYYGRPKEHFEFLQKFEGTLFLLEPDPDLPKARTFPLAEIEHEFGREYLTSTFAYMLAWVLHEHLHVRPVNNLHLYGINLTAMEEYAHQRPCAEYWLGRIEQAGILLSIPLASALLKGPVYPSRGEDLAAHAYTRLQHWKDNYMVAWANCNTVLAMQSETRHWDGFVGELMAKYPALFTEELKKDIRERIEKRDLNWSQLADKYKTDFDGALGVVKDCHHFLTMLGGVDFKAPSLPPLRIPSAKLERDFDVPDRTRTI